MYDTPKTSASMQQAHRAANPPLGTAAQLVIKLAYEGTNFHGFARQANQRTVQGDVEQALSTLLRREALVTCAGRTDAGVHASAQWVNTPLDAEELEAIRERPYRIARGLSALLPDDCAPRGIYLAEPSFSCRFDAISRTYRYLIRDGTAGGRSVLTRAWCWDVRDALDVAKMREAATHLIGEHDFRSLCKAESGVGKNTVRTLHRIDVRPVRVLDEELIKVVVEGNAFLHSMVRTLVGTLYEVGAGRRSVEWVKDVLAARDRQAAGQTAPAQGLTFIDVLYATDKIEELFV